MIIFGTPVRIFFVFIMSEILRVIFVSDTLKVIFSENLCEMCTNDILKGLIKISA